MISENNEKYKINDKNNNNNNKINNAKFKKLEVLPFA